MRIQRLGRSCATPQDSLAIEWKPAIKLIHPPILRIRKNEPIGVNTNRASLYKADPWESAVLKTRCARREGVSSLRWRPKIEGSGSGRQNSSRSLLDINMGRRVSKAVKSKLESLVDPLHDFGIVIEHVLFVLA